MVLLSVTPAIRDALEKYHAIHPDSEKETPEKQTQEKKVTEAKEPQADHPTSPHTPALPPPTSSSISHTQLIALARATRRPLAALTRNTAVHAAPLRPPPPPKTPEYLALMAALRQKRENDEYLAMVGGLATSTKLGYAAGSIDGVDPRDPAFRGYNLATGPGDMGEDALTPAQEIKVVREQLTTILNIGISVASVAYALWYCSGTYFLWPLPARTLLALFGAILVLVAETVVYLSYKGKVRDARAKERAKVEHKTLLTVGVDDVPETISLAGLAIEKTSIVVPALATFSSSASTKTSAKKRKPKK